MAEVQNIKEKLIFWVPFFCLFFFFWRVYNPFTQLPALGDALEILWGISWYNHALSQGVNPLLYPFVFHPEGWQVGSLAHTPIFFIGAQPFYWLGGEIFAYNMMAIIPFFIAYVGALKCFRHFSQNQSTVVVLALGYTFIAMRSSRAGGHLNVLWMTSILPFLCDRILTWQQLKADQDTLFNKSLLGAGVAWGLMIGFSLYSVFMAPVTFLFLGGKLLRWRIVPQLVVVGAIAFVFGLTAIGPYLYATANETIQQPNINDLIQFSISLDAIFIPSVFHSIPAIKRLAATLYPAGWGGLESNTFNFGLTSLILMIVGLFQILRGKGSRPANDSVLVLAIGLLLAIGPLLKISNQIVEAPILTSLNQSLWQTAHILKPDVFLGEAPAQAIQNGIPLPSYFLLAAVPKFESARVVARFAFIAFIGLLGLLALALDTLPNWLRLPLMLLWLVELLPIPTAALALPLETLHPAYSWLQTQPMKPTEGIVDVQEQIIHGPDTLWSAWQVRTPTAASIGSFFSEQHVVLREYTWDFVYRPPIDQARMLRAYTIRYVFIHKDHEREQSLYGYFGDRPDLFTQAGCFEPESNSGLPQEWLYPICVIEVLPHPVTNLFPTYGWSDEEPWGMWSIEEDPRFDFVATAAASHRVEAEVFPYCVDGQLQSIEFWLEETQLYKHEWQDCEPAQISFAIPAEFVSVGWHEIKVKHGYALSPAALGTGNDPRKLAVGFSKLSIRPQN
ncbi:MAG: hypothetical protein AAF902_17950 [Chloroflexota bacterium]